jgi:hypothetical protein
MSPAIIVWGSLYWDPRNLETTGKWLYDGPVLPIEFARISSDRRLTLVIKPAFKRITTLYAISSYEDYTVARENLRQREKTDNIGNIGFIDFQTHTYHVRSNNSFVLDILRQWNENKGFDAVIWSDFSPNFTVKTGKAFTSENIIEYLGNLDDSARNVALDYIHRTPKQITTRFRDEIEQHYNCI